MNKYQERCFALANLLTLAGETGRQIQCKSDGEWVNKDITLVYINPCRIEPIPSKVARYIKLKLDMEFTNHPTFLADAPKLVGKLISIMCDNDKLTFTTEGNNKTQYSKCRLRPNHVHFWNRFAENPIPDNCEFRICNRTWEWSNWRIFNARTNYVFNGPAEKPIIAFEIRYQNE